MRNIAMACHIYTITEAIWPLTKSVSEPSNMISCYIKGAKVYIFIFLYFKFIKTPIYCYFIYLIWFFPFICIYLLIYKLFIFHHYLTIASFIFFVFKFLLPLLQSLLLLLLFLLGSLFWVDWEGLRMSKIQFLYKQ